MDKLSLKSRPIHNSKNTTELGVGVHNLTSKLKRKQTNTLCQKMKIHGKDSDHLKDDVMNKLISPITLKTSLANESQKNKTKKKEKINKPKSLSGPIGLPLPLLDDFFDSKNASDHKSRDSDTDLFSVADFFPTRETLRREDCEMEYGPLIYCPKGVASAELEKPKKKKKCVAVNERDAESILENSPMIDVQESLEEIPILEKVEPVTFYEIPKKKFLVKIEHPSTLFFQGQLNIKVVFGSLEILGCTITSEIQKSLAAFSPGTSSLLGLHALCHTDKHDNIENVLIELGVDVQLAHYIVDGLLEKHSLFVVDKVCTTLPTYLASQCLINLYPRCFDRMRLFWEEEGKLQCLLETRKEKLGKTWSKTQAWDDLASTIIRETSGNTNATGSARVMICGGKSVGKSTLLRYLINKNLSHVKEVLFLDFDPGQAEFTVPGCVSVVRVSDPLLGPNFTHLCEPERTMYIGEVDVSQCPDRYMKCAQHIIDYCQSKPEFEKMVWFINTMGFNKGLGVELTSSLIQMVKPTHLVQIESRSEKRNFPNMLTPANIVQNCNRWIVGSEVDHSQLTYSHIVLQSLAEETQRDKNNMWGLQAKIAREIVVLSYINQMLAPPRSLMSLMDIVPYRVPFNRLKLSISHKSVHYSQFLNVINANLVSLCSIEEDDEHILKPNDPTLPCVLAQPPVVPSLGFGIVRGVDLSERMVYLITQLSEQDLSAVNCLVMGVAVLPVSVYTASSSGRVPYVKTGPGQTTSKGIFKRFTQLTKK